MQNLTVNCGCGRSMTIDSLQGRGAFRCGCGARVTIVEPCETKSRCVGMAKGTACRFPTAIEDPLPLCRQHYRSTGLERYARWCELAPDGVFGLIQENNWFRVALTFQNEQMARPAKVPHCPALDPEANRETLRREMAEAFLARMQHAVVYFVRIGDLVKIGKSLDLRNRIVSFSYPYLELLATEPGYTEREHQLHDQFADLRVSGEWFRYEAPLRDYVESLQARCAIEALAGSTA